MAAFHEVRFPFAIALGAAGGPERRTEIVTLGSGREERNTPWANSRRRWDAGPGVVTLDDLHEVLAFFEARRGRLHGFRFRDPLDHKSCAPSQTPSASDQAIGAGDGAATAFQLVKAYASGGESWTRTIANPVDGSVVAAVGGVPADPGAFTADPATGLITFNDPPGAGAAVTAGFEFDTPVRFDTDRFEASIEAFRAGAPISLPVIEIAP